jgi:hypothetical protein
MIVDQATQSLNSLFDHHDLTNNAQIAHTRKLWNQAFSKERVVVEHAFGQLKDRFPALRMMPGWSLGRMYRAIEAILVIHNRSSQSWRAGEQIFHTCSYREYRSPIPNVDPKGRQVQTSP